MNVYKKQVDLFNKDDAKKILQFSIHHINKNLKINNNLINKEISQKFLKKIKKINEYYSNFKKQKEVEFKNFLQKIKNNSKKELDFDEQLITYMIIMSEKIYYQTPRLIQIICLLYYLEGYKEAYGLILEVLTGEGKTLTISFLDLYLSILKQS